MKKRFKKIYIEITNNCNLNCDFCIKNKRKSKYLSIDEFKLLLDKVKDYTNYLYFHILGEPLMHPLINEFIDLGSSKFKINITTNGYLVHRIKDNKNIRQLNISLHSYDVVYGISLLNYLENVFDVVDTLRRNGTYISLRLWVKNKHNQKVLNYINNRYNLNINEIKGRKKIEENLYIDSFHEFVWPDMNNDVYDNVGTCYALKDHIGILVDGTVVPCCLDSLGDINLGNIYSSSLESIINSEKVNKMICGFQNNKKCEELCKHCKFLTNKCKENS